MSRSKRARVVIDDNREAERTTLGAILINNDLFAQVHAILRPEDFSRDAHQRIWRAMLAVQAAHRAIDLVTLHDELTKSGDLDAAGGPAYISSLADGVPLSTNAAHYARITRQYSLRRRLRVLAATGGDVEDIERCARDLKSLNGAQAPAGTPLDDSALWMPTPASQLASNVSGAPATVARGLFYKERLTCLHSPKKTGKSTILAAAVAAITSATEFLDEPTEPGTVLWIGEEAANDIAVRHRQFSGNPERLFVTDARRAVRYAPGLTPIERLRHMIRAADADALVIDTLTHLARLLGVRSMSTSIEAQELIDVVLEIARSGIPVVFTHHQPRAAEGRGYEPRMRDSTAFEAAVDAEVAFKRTGPEVTLTPTGARWELPTLVAKLDRDKSRFTLTDVRNLVDDEHNDQHNPNEARDWCAEVERAVSQRPEEAWTMTKLKKFLRTGRSYEALTSAVNVMVDVGTLESYRREVCGMRRECFRLATSRESAAHEREPGDEDPDEL